MKKVFSLMVLLLALITLSACKGADIKILMPGDYINLKLLKDFKKETGKKVKIVTFESNEAALIKLKMEKFDLVVPSDYMVEQMIFEDLLQPIDWELITELDKETSFPDELQSLLSDYQEEFPILDYHVPYFWGNLGILYDKTKVSLELLESEEWNIFANEDLKIVIYDSSRDGFFFALKQLGYSGNTNDDKELEDAESYLKAIAKHKNVVFLTDEILDDMKTSKYDLSLTYSGDAVYLMSKNSKLDFYVPKVGTNVFVDGFSIPKDATNLDVVYQFINFISRQENALKNTLDVMYQSPRKDVYESLISPGSELYDYLSAYQVIRNENDELFRYDKDAKEFIDDAWAKIRSSN